MLVQIGKILKTILILKTQMEKLRDNYIMSIYKGKTNEKITFINDTGSGIWVIDQASCTYTNCYINDNEDENFFNDSSIFIDTSTCKME